MRLCQPLALHCRDALLRILAYELRGRRDVGDGELHRIARTIIKDNSLFDPPDLDGRMPHAQRTLCPLRLSLDVAACVGQLVEATSRLRVHQRRFE
jgi:hypothetical protein